VTAAGWYAVAVSTSIFQLLLGLGLWKWLMWTFFAFRLSTCNLRLVSTRPDTFAAAAVVRATWRQSILHDGAHLMDFKLPAIALAVITALVALPPLAFFVPRLAELRRKDSGIWSFGAGLFTEPDTKATFCRQLRPAPWPISVEHTRTLVR
jgi:hypothetical protein